jgi:hypothetical protein
LLLGWGIERMIRAEKVFILLVVISILIGWTHGSGAIAFPPFQGNPNTTITAPINTSGGIFASRTACMVPCAIYVSSRNVTATGTSVPWEDLGYGWNFGDSTGTEIITDPRTGLSVNLNSSQTGPSAAYMFRTACSCVVTLTVEGHNAGGNIKTTVTRTITVSNFVASGGEFYVDFSAAGGGSGTIGSPFNSLAQVNSNMASNTAWHFKHGTSTTGATTLTALTSNSSFSTIRFDDKNAINSQTIYGSGAPPDINVNSGAASAIDVVNGSQNTPTTTRSDIVFTGLKIENSGAYSAGSMFHSINQSNGGSIFDIYLDNVTLANTLDINGFEVVDMSKTNGNASPAGDSYSYFGYWNTTISGPTNSTGNRQGVAGGTFNGVWIVGGAISGAGQTGFFDHHVYLHTQFDALVSYVNFGSSGVSPSRNYSVKIAYDKGDGASPGTSAIAQYTNVNSNLLTGTARATNLGNVTNDPTVTTWNNCVESGNAYVNLTSSPNVQPYTATTFTLRYGRAWGSSGDWYAPTPASGATNNYLAANVYFNSIYKIDGGVAIINYKLATYSLKQEVTDNKFYGTSASAILQDIIYADQTSAGSIINRNTNFAPNATSGLFNNASQVTFANWQANLWDVNGNNVAPSPAWTVPPTSWASFGP